MLAEASHGFELTRSIRLHAYAEDCAPSIVAFINLNTRGLDCRANHMYRMQEVTGLNFAVQAVLVTQSETAMVLLDACLSIEAHGLTDFAFVCRGGTHRSVACCVLLAALIYQNSEVCLNTRRTREAALELGMAP